MNPTSPALEFHAVEKHYPRFHLGPIELAVPRGAIYGLIGPNGAGKSTLLDQIFGMGTPDAGSIRVCGLDVQRDDVAVKSQTAYASPELNYAAWGEIGAAIRFVKGFRPSWDDDACARLLKAFGLSAADRIATLSFGGRMKLALVLALSWKPRVLALDEPATGLDPQARRVLYAELLAIVRDEDRTVLMSSHQISDVERFADHIGILHGGRLLADGSTDELLERYRMLEFTSENAGAPASIPGWIPAENEGQRWRGLLDTSRSTVESAAAAIGGRDIQLQPLTLEEMFLNLTKQSV